MGCAARTAHLCAYRVHGFQASMYAMSNDDSLKKQLPFPYDQDLSKVLTHLDRRTPSSRERLANDPVTAAYIAAAVRLVGRHLGPDPKRVLVDPNDLNSLARPLLSFVSLRAVADEVSENPDPFPRQGNVSTMRSTWKSHSDFIADLVNFVVWPGNHPRNFYDEIDARAKSLLEGPDAVDAVHDLAYLNVAEDISWPASRLATHRHGCSRGRQDHQRGHFPKLPGIPRALEKALR